MSLPFMNLPHFHRFCSLFFLLVWSCGLGAFAQKNTKPNIIYIYADDIGYGELGIYGQKKIRTPNIDRIGKEGIIPLRVIEL